LKRQFGLVVGLVFLLLAAGSARIQAADQAPNGYWKFNRCEVGPKPEYYPKPMPGRLLEADSKGAFDAAAGSVQNTCVWNVDDIERHPYTMASSFVVQADHSLAFLIPGKKLNLSGAARLTGNCPGGCGAEFMAGIDNGEAFRISKVGVGQSASNQGVMIVAGGAPGAGMRLWITSYLASLGAWGGDVQVFYQWEAGPPPAGGAIGGGSGTGSGTGTGGGTGTGAGSSSGTTGGGTISGTGTGGGTGTGTGGRTGTGTGGGTTGGTGAGMALRAETAKAKAGETVTVPIYLDNSSGLANMNFNVVYESKVAQAGNPTKGAMLPSQMLMVPNFGNTGLVRIGLAGPDDIKGSGTIVQIPFKAIGPPGATTELKLEVTTVRGASGSTPPLQTINGRIDIIAAPPTGGTGGGTGTSGGGGVAPGGTGTTGSGPGTVPGTGGGIPGDANGNGVLEAVDALQALKMSVGLIPENLICDMDKDGRVTSTDARLILSKVVGK